MEEQRIILPPRATSFRAVCATCQAEQPASRGYLGAIVEGALALDDDRGSVVCPRGPNAGHTIIAGGETFKLRQLPTGVVSGKTSVIGAGCVIDPEVLLGELDELGARGLDPSVVVVSGNAHLIMPWHLAIDRASERRLGKLRIGTTRRGIGPAYADKASRLGIRVQDVLDPKILRQKIEVALAEKNVWLERVYEDEPFDLEDVAARYEGYAQRLRPFVGDVALRYAVRLNGFTSLALTKLDVLSAFEEIPVCVRYLLPDGSETEDFPAHQSDFHHCRPVYETLPGWQEPLEDGLPPAARAYVELVERELEVEVSLVGTGAARERRQRRYTGKRLVQRAQRAPDLGRRTLAVDRLDERPERKREASGAVRP